MTAFISKDKKKFNLLYFLPLQNGRDRKSSIYPAPNRTQSTDSILLESLWHCQKPTNNVYKWPDYSSQSISIHTSRKKCWPSWLVHVPFIKGPWRKLLGHVMKARQHKSHRWTMGRNLLPECARSVKSGFRKCFGLDNNSEPVMTKKWIG